METTTSTHTDLLAVMLAKRNTAVDNARQAGRALLQVEKDTAMWHKINVRREVALAEIDLLDELIERVTQNTEA